MYTIIIPTFNRKLILERTIKNLNLQTNKQFKIIIVNDGSKDGTDEMLDNFDNLIVLNSDGDLWWTGSVNLGIKYVLSNFQSDNGIILLNDDVIIKENWFESLSRDIKNFPNCLIGCLNVDATDMDTITYAGKRTHPWFAYSNYYLIGKKLSELKEIPNIEPFDLIGRGLYIPIQAIKQLGFFDSKRFKHRGDTEFPLRAKINGYKLKISHTSIVGQMKQLTSGIDTKKKYSLRDIKEKFFHFKSSSYIKYLYYYSKTHANGNFIKFFVFFSCRIIANLNDFFRRL